MSWLKLGKKELVGPSAKSEKLELLEEASKS